MSDLSPRRRPLPFLALLALACAGLGHVREADVPVPDTKDTKAIDGEVERAGLESALEHLRQGDVAKDQGNAAEAATEWKAGAEALVELAEHHPSSDWRLVYRKAAAEALLKAQEPERAAELCARIGADPKAGPASKSVAARIAAQAWQAAAVAEAKAGKLEPIRLLTQERRKGAELKPRPPPGSWKRFVDAADAYLTVAKDDPAQKSPPPDAPGAAPIAAQTALYAAEVEYAFDNLEEARRRLERILATWPGEASVVEAAIPLQLQTYLLLPDGEEAYQAALDTDQELVDAQLKKALAAGASARVEPFRKLSEQLGNARRSAGFFAGKKLLEAGKPAEAAAAFESFAESAKGEPDAALALYNASVAWDKAGESGRADAGRRRLLEEFPEARVTPQALLALANSLSRRSGDHAQAQELYQKYLEKWPQGENRCLALLNIGYEYDQQQKPLDAAARYVTFGKDAACAKADPNSAARALYRAGVLFSGVKKSEEARQAFTALAAMPGPFDEVTRTQVEDARKRVKRKK